jgi:CRISPR-associated helicase Cas3/CRISPR-associated endonuclease Cas3-HD
MDQANSSSDSTPTYWAHSENRAGLRHPLKVHLSSVAELARGFAKHFPYRDEAHLAGLLHDLGKYGERFQGRLDGEYEGVDHWSAGAWMAAREHMAFAAALAIEGHHIGLQRMTEQGLRALAPEALIRQHPLGLRMSDDDPEALKARLRRDGLAPDFDGRTQPTVLRKLLPDVASMLDVRMLFSCLTDADFLDTEAHFRGDAQSKRYRMPGAVLNPGEVLRVLEARIASLKAATQASEDVRLARQHLWECAWTAGAAAPGLFTATAPTGTGKTLALLAMALRHAQLNGLDRVIVVLPFLNIIEQTADQYRQLFKDAGLPEDAIVEHHTLAYSSGTNPLAEMRGRALAENWDAPLVITTTVQFFESLFTNRPGAARKLHRIARSVILFDEAQTLPPDLAAPTLASLAHLQAHYGSSVVFATATQPAFDALDGAVRSLGAPGWQPREIVSDQQRLFGRVRRVHVAWQIGTAQPPEALAAALWTHRQGMAIFNTRRQALACFAALQGGGQEGFYLATNQCAAHRLDTLAVIRQRLGNGLPCRVVATQCVEAGVDLDFPILLRALAPLDAIAQAAGRCNREGRLGLGEMVVFRPEAGSGAAFPDSTYQRAAGIVERMVQERGSIDLYDPEVYRHYFLRLYTLNRVDQGAADLVEAVRLGDFESVASRYRLIAQRDQINLVVPYNATRFAELAELAGHAGVDANWLRKAQRHSVAVSRTWAARHAGALGPVRSRFGGELEGWALLRDATLYDPRTGCALI